MEGELDGDDTAHRTCDLQEGEVARRIPVSDPTMITASRGRWITWVLKVDLRTRNGDPPIAANVGKVWDGSIR
jgi:hypothetical protein